ncbi:hypothetical protein KQI41_16535 [Tissierella pigra]|nr:hypothetical protein [Tissierella pigra]MBU5428001.1 hypothetical protein [Tissierella pigra]
MKELYKINSHYSKRIKFFKVFILFLTFILLQIYIPVFHGNEVLMDKLQEEGVDLTNFYVPYKTLYNFPEGFDRQLLHNDIYTRYKVESYKTRDVFTTVFRDVPARMIDGYYIENVKDTNFKMAKGKEIYNLSKGEVAVSEYYAYNNFGSIRKAMGKTIEVPIEYVIYEGLLNEEKVMNDVLQYKIVSIYKNNGLTKRFLNILGNGDKAEDSNKEFMYSDTLIVSDDDFQELNKKYINTYDNNRNIYKKYSIYFDEFDTHKEIDLRARLNIYVDNYMPYFIKSELTYKVLNNSDLSNRTTRFFVTFEFISILVLIFTSIIYLIYLQNKYLSSYRKSLNTIGIERKRIGLSTLFHESLLTVLGISVWLIFNLLLKLIFEIKLVFLNDIFQFNKYIIKYMWIPILFYIGSITIGYSIYGILGRRNKVINIKNHKTNIIIDKIFYFKRILSLNISKYILLSLIVLVIGSSLFIINGNINTMKDIYLNSNVFKYDIYANAKAKVVTDIIEGAESTGVLTVNRESLLAHIYSENNGEDLIVKSMVVNAAVFYGEVDKFFNEPKIGTLSRLVDTWGDYVEKYSYYEEPSEELNDEKFGFDMIVSNSVAKKLNLDTNSYCQLIPEELNSNIKAVYPISGITNIFSNDMNTVYLLPREERFEKVKNHLSFFRRGIDSEGFYNIMMVFDNEEKKMETIEKLEEYKETGDVAYFSVNNGKMRLNDLGELSTMVSKIMMRTTLLCYLILLLIIYGAKKSDDELTQRNNIKAYYNMGADSADMKKAFSYLNISTLAIGTVLGLVIYLMLSSTLSDYMYEIMEVIK